MGHLVRKAGTDFSSIAPAGVRILEHLKQIAATCAFDVTITSACDGAHSGPADPHHTGEAYDVRTQGLTLEQVTFLIESLHRLGGRFYAFVEDPGTANAHIHVQRTKGTTYTIDDYLRSA